MPLTPYAVSNGSFSKKANARTFDAHNKNMVTATAISNSSTQRPSPLAMFSDSGFRKAHREE